MKAPAVLAMMALLSLHGPALAAGFQGPDAGAPGAEGSQGQAAGHMGGFQGPVGGSQISTVSAALKAWDDTPATLTGHITQRMAGSDDKYMFRDATGEMLVDIDHELFVGRVVTPQTTVRLHGEVDKDLMKPTKLDVKFLEIVQ